MPRSKKLLYLLERKNPITAVRNLTRDTAFYSFGSSAKVKFSMAISIICEELKDY